MEKKKEKEELRLKFEELAKGIEKIKKRHIDARGSIIPMYYTATTESLIDVLQILDVMVERIISLEEKIDAFKE